MYPLSAKYSDLLLVELVAILNWDSNAVAPLGSLQTNLSHILEWSI
jgi:hypothetical protein